MKIMGSAKDKSMILLKTDTTKDYNKLTPFKSVHGGRKKPRKLKIQKQSADKIIINIRYLFK